MNSRDGRNHSRISGPLEILFVGESLRGEMVQEAAQADWRFHIHSDVEQALALYASVRPNLVILDRFPESQRAREVFYRLRGEQGGPFLALNETPDAMQFTMINRLSFMRIIGRTPRSRELREAVAALVKVVPERETGIQGQACCGGRNHQGRPGFFADRQLRACC